MITAIFLIIIFVLMSSINCPPQWADDLEISTTPKSPPITVLVDSEGGRVDWSHKNNLIAFCKLGADSFYDVYIMNPDGSGQVSLTKGKTEIPDYNNGIPAWHPSGDFIVFQAQDPKLKIPFFAKRWESYLTQGGSGLHNNLWIVTRDGKQFFQLTQLKDREFTLHPHFSHNGTKLFWTERTRGGKRFGGKWVLKLADFAFDRNHGPSLKNIKTIDPHPQKSFFYESHGFTPNDTKIIFSTSIGRKSRVDLDIWTMDLDTGKLTQLTDTAGVWDEHAHYSPDGKKIVWISSQGFDFKPTKNWGETLTTEFWIMDADGTKKRRLTYFNQPGYPEYTGERTICADSAWNHDGTQLIGSQRVGERNRIVLIDMSVIQTE
ncbi:MAG: hypothetical protein PVJ84_01065 [Desulfobacteraceae bacterium]|jgi:Tol biopolymer transport system component